MILLERLPACLVICSLLIACLHVTPSRCQVNNSGSEQSPTASSDGLCFAHRREFDTMEDYSKKCDVSRAVTKFGAGTLEQADIVGCYRPQCDSHGKYIIKQCSFLFHEWCWCSSPDGYAIPGTFQNNMPEGYCSYPQKSMCKVDEILYEDGEIFKPPNLTFCGFCECLDGTHTCFMGYTPNATTGELSTDQLDDLKIQLIQVFNLQFESGDHDLHIDIRQIYQHTSDLKSVSTSQKETVLGWKFNHYDRNQDDILNQAEEFIFHRELFDFFGCNLFFDHLSVLFDENGNHEITLQEWNAFFGIVFSESPSIDGSGAEVSAVTGAVQSAAGQPVKREASLTPLVARKPLHHRKKFRYVLS